MRVQQVGKCFFCHVLCVSSCRFAKNHIAQQKHILDNKTEEIPNAESKDHIFRI